MYTVDEVAEYLNLSNSRVRELIRRGELAYVLKNGYSRRVYHVSETALKVYSNLRSIRMKLKHAEKLNQKQLQSQNNIAKSIAKSKRSINLIFSDTIIIF